VNELVLFESWCMQRATIQVYFGRIAGICDWFCGCARASRRLR